MITEIQRTLSGIYSSANSTIIFDSNPYLLANSDVILYFTNNDSRFAASVTSVSGNNAVVNFTDNQYANNRVTIKTPCYNSDITGPQEVFTLQNSTIPNTLIQATVYGTGGASLNIEVSSDKKGWINAANISVTSVSNTEFFNIGHPWPYARLNISSIDSGTTLIATKAN